MASGRDLTNSWDVLGEDSQDLNYSPETHFTSPSPSSDEEDDVSTPLPTPPSRRKQIPTRSTPPASRRDTGPRRRTSKTPRSSVETSPIFIMPSPYSPADSFRTRRSTQMISPPRIDPPSPVPRKSSRKTSSNRPKNSADDSIQNVANNFVLSTMNASINLLFQTLSWLTPFLAPILALAFVISGLYIFGYYLSQQILGHIPTSISWAVPKMISPCGLPLVSRFPMCGFSKPPPIQSAQTFDVNHLVDIQDNFGQIVDLSETVTWFPENFRQSEKNIHFLRDIIKFQSQLPSKADLIMQFDHFVQLSRETRTSLTRFAVHGGGAADKIYMMNRATMNTLSDFTAAQKSIEMGSIVSRVWSSLTGSPKGITEQKVLWQYLQHANAVERETDALINQGQAILVNLHTMEKMLDDMRETAGKDMAGLLTDKEELFSSLWTRFGGNAADRNRLRKNIAVAEKIRETNSQATHVVQMTLDQLHRIKFGLDELQKRVMTPANREGMDLVEWEEHIIYIQNGMDRLYQIREASRIRVKDRFQKITEFGSAFQNAERPDLEGR